MMNINPWKLRYILAWARVDLLASSLIGALWYSYIVIIQDEATVQLWHKIAAWGMMMPYQLNEAWKHVKQKNWKNLPFTRLCSSSGYGSSVFMRLWHRYETWCVRNIQLASVQEQ